MAATDEHPKITLHWLNTSRAQATLWLLEEMKIPYELKPYQRQKDRLAPPELKDVHPLGKSPIVTIETSASSQPLVLAESAAIAEYLCDYYGSSLVPKRYREGQEGKIGGETESWLRYRHFMYYVEGSLFPYMLIALILHILKTSPMPFFIRPITNAIVSRITTSFLRPNFETHYKFLESQLETSPDGGRFLCGKDLTAVDMLMVLPLQLGQQRSGMTKERFPRVYEYVAHLQEQDGFKRAAKKAEELQGGVKTNL